jgi:murein DD-endopeptidase MepM/ murein hydrolase activator NlpD
MVICKTNKVFRLCSFFTGTDTLFGTVSGNFIVSYCHLSQIFVSQGKIVMPGNVVGISGNTGRSTGEHLHMTIRHNGEYINPRIFLDYISSVKLGI